MLNALEELRKIRTATQTIGTATACNMEPLPPACPMKSTEAPPPLTREEPKPSSSDRNVCEWSQAATDVVTILVEVDRPVPHPEIVRLMERRGHDKTTAKQAIAHCQKRRWIEHNLMSGYILCQ